MASNTRLEASTYPSRNPATTPMVLARVMFSPALLYRAQTMATSRMVERTE